MKVRKQIMTVKTFHDVYHSKNGNGPFSEDMDKIAEIPTMNVKMAMCVLAAGPILFVFPFFQKYFVKGIAVGSVKG